MQSKTNPTVLAGSSATLRQFAVYIANLFFLTSEAWAPVVTDAELDKETADQYNLILVGSPLENSWVQKYHGKVPLKYQDKSLSLGMLLLRPVFGQSAFSGRVGIFYFIMFVGGEGYTLI